MNLAASSPDPDQSLRREILSERKFSIAEAIGREGGDFLKGVSPVPPLVQAKLTLQGFVDEHLEDNVGALETSLQAWIAAEDAVIGQHLEHPLEALKRILDHILTTPEQLHELVRRADVCWGEIYDERPYFQRPGEHPHPNDEYTHDSVRSQLLTLQARVEAYIQHPSI